MRSILQESREGHKFNYERVKIITLGRIKRYREFLRAWRFSERSINRHTNVGHVYMTMRSKDQLAQLIEIEADSVHNAAAEGNNEQSNNPSFLLCNQSPPTTDDRAINIGEKNTCKRFQGDRNTEGATPAEDKRFAVKISS